MCERGFLFPCESRMSGRIGENVCYVESVWIGELKAVGEKHLTRKVQSAHAELVETPQHRQGF